MHCIQNENYKRKNPTILRIPDQLWDKIKKILPKKNHPRLLVDQLYHTEKVLDDILYVLRTGCQWEMLSKEYGSGSTCHSRFQEWNKLGVFKRTWIRLLKTYDNKIGITWTWRSLDSISIKSPLGGND